MEFTIQLPWLSRMRRMAISLSLVLVLVALALPASAAPPDGIEGEVIVVNDATNPVPVTGSVDATVDGSVTVSGEVTVGNEPTDPVPVSGSVNAAVTGSVAATQSGAWNVGQAGDWTVGLASPDKDNLATVASATGGLTFDGAGNLNVNVASGGSSNGPPGFSSGGAFTEAFALDAGNVAATSLFGVEGVPKKVTALTVGSNQPLWIRMRIEPAPGARTTYAVLVQPGETLAEAFAFPILATHVYFENLGSSPATVYIGATTLDE